MIQANSRNNFTAEDFSFITDALAEERHNRAALADLFSDDEMLDRVLDHTVLFQRVVESGGFTQISPYLYFYVLSRRALLECNITDRGLADYISSLLAEFSSSRRAFSPSEDHEKQYHYLVDMLSDFMDASSWEAFLIRSHVGNYALFLTGMFPDYVYNKATYGRKAPGFDYYEKMGSNSFHWAAQNKYAAEYRLAEILSELGDQFRQVRIALNNLSDKYLSLREKPDSMDILLRRIFFDDDTPEN